MVVTGPSGWLNSQIITTDACTASYRKKVLSLHLQDNLELPCSGVSKVPAASDWVPVSHLRSLYRSASVQEANGEDRRNQSWGANSFVGNGF